MICVDCGPSPMMADPLSPAMQPPASSATDNAGRSNRIRLFLDGHIKAPSGLSTELPSLVARLDRERRALEGDLFRLEGQLTAALIGWFSRSAEVRGILARLDDYRPPSSCDKIKRMLEVELPSLKKELGRIEKFRIYAETSLSLEGLVGDLEDISLAIMGQASVNNFSMGTVWKLEKMQAALRTIGNIENLLVSISSNQPQWTHLMAAVDFRVEKNLLLLRSQALTDYRGLLASVGWPPSFSSKVGDKLLEVVNPLSVMQGEKKENFSKSFLVLCALQQLQVHHEARLNGVLRRKGSRFLASIELERSLTLDGGLWVINELVDPIASRMEQHLFKWSDQPKFSFALVYKVTRDLLDGVDNLLQPLIDKARILGFGAKEAWVKTMIKVLSMHLERDILPILVKDYREKNETAETITSWIYLIDLMTRFDKRMRDLGTSGPLVPLEELAKSMSIFSVFDGHLDWLYIWAEIEINDAEGKLKAEAEDESNWLNNTQKQVKLIQEDAESFSPSAIEDFKAPSIAENVVKITWEMIERAGFLPNMLMKVEFIRSSVVIFLNNFLLLLVQQCQDIETELMNTCLEDNVLVRISCCINTGRHIEFAMRSWNEDVSFLEITFDENVAKNRGDKYHNSFFEEEIMYLAKLGTDCIANIMSAILLQFDAECYEYINNITQWTREAPEQINPAIHEQCSSVSPCFIKALHILEDSLAILHSNLNPQDFLDLWRSIADGLDHFIFRSIPLGKSKFSPLGVYQLKADVNAIFQIFVPFCTRPEAFFPCTSDSLKLLMMSHKDVAYLLSEPAKEGDKVKGEFLRLRGVSNVTVSQAEMILRNRVFIG